MLEAQVTEQQLKSQARSAMPATFTGNERLTTDDESPRFNEVTLNLRLRHKLADVEQRSRDCGPGGEFGRVQ